TKLREALQEKPEAVTAFFNEKATNMKDFIKGYVQYGSGILAEKQESIGRLMKDVDRQIERLEERVAYKEASLIRQFTALEKAMSAFQSQSDWLNQQINQLSSWAPQKKR
ncbi:MAG: flagellar filament capping protein FliD, partial [Firmicutes bacterium]|nr:flagellar filament capping protein FliD [Bacillota bacterium]